MRSRLWLRLETSTATRPFSERRTSVRPTSDSTTPLISVQRRPSTAGAGSAAGVTLTSGFRGDVVTTAATPGAAAGGVTAAVGDVTAAVGGVAAAVGDVAAAVGGVATAVGGVTARVEVVVGVTTGAGAARPLGAPTRAGAALGGGTT